MTNNKHRSGFVSIIGRPGMNLIGFKLQPDFIMLVNQFILINSLMKENNMFNLIFIIIT